MAIFSAAIIFARPFAAYVFALPSIGLHLVAGYLVTITADYINHYFRPAAVVFYVLMIVLAIVPVTLWMQDYTTDPLLRPQQTKISHQVLDRIRDGGYDVSHYGGVYFIGFPVELFADGAEPQRSADIFEVYLGHSTQVTQIATLDELSSGQCHKSLVFMYDSNNLMREIDPPACNDF